MLKGPIARSAVSTSLVLVLRLLVQAGTLLVVARMLGPEQFGVFAAIAALAVLFGAFSTFGTHWVLLGEVSKNQESCSYVLSYAVPTTLICSSLLLFLYLLICNFFLKTSDIPWFVYIFIGITEVVLLPLYLLPTIPFLAEGRTAFSQFLTILPLIIRFFFAVLIFLISFEKPLELFTCMYFLASIIVLFFMWLYKKRAWLGLSEWRCASRQELKESAGYAVLSLTAMGPTELDKVLAIKILPLGGSGLYAVASRIIGAATLPVIALLLSAMPKMFRDAEQNPIKNHRLLKWIFISVLLYGFTLVGFLWLLAPIIEWLFGKEYSGLIEMLQWLSFVVPGLALRIAGGSILMTMHKPWWRVGFEILGMIVLVCSVLIFYQQWGAKAMILALLCSEWSMAIMSIILILWRSDFTERLRLFWRRS